jgi:hypothetical protein
MKALPLILALAGGLLVNAPVQAQTLLADRAQASDSAQLPARGQSMAQVEARFGAPTEKLAAVAGPNNRTANPPISRWVYPAFTVYFENSHVVSAVVNRASAAEIGPQPVN